ASNWVEQEFNQGLVHQASYPQFPVIPVRFEDFYPPLGLFAHSAVDAFGGRLHGSEAATLLRSIHGVPDLTPQCDVKSQVIQSISSLAGEPISPLEAVRVPIMYVTCGWRAAKNEEALRTGACQELTREGFYLIGDAEDHSHTDKERIAAIMAGCSSHLILLPKRGEAASVDHAEYNSIRAEIEIGKVVGLPQFCVHEKGLVPPSEIVASLPCDLSTPDTTADSWIRLNSWMADLDAIRTPPRRLAFVFVATDYEDLVVKDHVVRHISQITGLPCLKGTDFGRQSPSRKIAQAIRHASLVIANVVSSTRTDGHPDINWNTCIEGGIALGAGTPLQIIARRAVDENWTLKDNLPFMIRDNSIGTYPDDQHLMAIIHRAARPFRRRYLGL
ncbi:MAG: hypothetical protein ABI614_12375, partial [Planctomycetota bacterium]